MYIVPGIELQYFYGTDQAVPVSSSIEKYQNQNLVQLISPASVSLSACNMLVAP